MVPKELSCSLPWVVVLTGPTGVGKTEISLELAQLLNAEIISADSMQVYQGMDIGTAKATPAQRARVTHHLLDVVSPVQPFSVYDYQRLARAAIDDITQRGKLPLFVGGSGLYLRAALTPYRFTQAPADRSLRKQLQQRAQEEGSLALYQELQQLDPESALVLHPNDLRRIIRALEVYLLTGQSISVALQETKSTTAPYQTLWFALNRERQELYRRIDHRVWQMIAAGLEAEVRSLQAQGLLRGSDAEPNIAGQALGYKELLPYLAGELSLEAAVAKIQQESRRYARRQLIWFRAQQQLTWLMLDENSNSSQLAKEIADMVFRTLAH